MTGPRRDAGRRQPTSARGRPWSRVLGGVVWIAALPCIAHAGVFRPGEVSVALLAGGSRPVPALADYQWDVRPHVGWGVQGLAGFGPVATGLRYWSTGTTQELGLPGQPDSGVRAQSLELVARARVAAWRLVSVNAMASGGRMALRWDPDHVTVDAGGTPVEVQLRPIHEWVGGLGLGLEAPLPGDWSLGLEAERRAFALDTAHRSGSSVVYARETFGDWSGRFSLRRAWHR